ncbi:hypothetical protein J8J27_34810, partial [Mycobacterium tuberculosis]|nr:hypothetical protein [Mycobacterium tuberculosis]
GLAAAIIVGTGFTRPFWLPAPMHAWLLRYNLAKPLPAAATAAVAEPARPGQRPAAAGGRPVAVEAAPVIVGPVRATLT